MGIYRITQNIDNFMFFSIDDMDIYEKMEDFDINAFGKLLDFEWVSPGFSFNKSDTGSTILPDITQWTGSDLVLSNKAKHSLQILPGDVGEYLPLADQDGEYWLFNPTCRLGNEIINLEKTKSSYFDDGSWDRIEKLVFKTEAESTAPLLFTLELESGITLFCNQHFKDAVEAHGLSGINFSAVEQG
jgi:hypothetical protein